MISSDVWNIRRHKEMMDKLIDKESYKFIEIP